MELALAAGFGDLVLDAQRTFRAVMEALARPGSVQPLGGELVPPPPLPPELAAVALTLADHDAPLWLDAPLAQSRDVADYLRFHTGAAIVADPAQAAVALVADAAHCPPFEQFAQGTAEYPDRSTLVMLAVSELAAAPGFALVGPGIPGTAQLRVAPVPADMLTRVKRNGALFPRGIDLLLVAPGRVAGLPRTTEITDIRPCMSP